VTIVSLRDARINQDPRIREIPLEIRAQESTLFFSVAIVKRLDPKMVQLLSHSADWLQHLTPWAGPAMAVNIDAELGG
jgi:hypothetical protein